MPPPSVVLDTNVIVSAHLNSHGLERFVLDLALGRKIFLLASQPILAEYEYVLSRKKFGIYLDDVSESLRLIRSAALIITPQLSLHACSDAPTTNSWSALKKAAQITW